MYNVDLATGAVLYSETRVRGISEDSRYVIRRLFILYTSAKRYCTRRGRLTVYDKHEMRFRSLREGGGGGEGRTIKLYDLAQRTGGF